MNLSTFSAHLIQVHMHPLDFHSLNALHWDCSRQLAKQAVLFNMYGGEGGTLEPRFLDRIHPDNRAALLAGRGIVLGEG
jgi:hypothetical protein